MGDGTKKQIKHVKQGDIVMSANNTKETILSIESSRDSRIKKMVRLGDFWITRGHPIFIKGEWFRPDELYPTVESMFDQSSPAPLASKLLCGFPLEFFCLWSFPSKPCFS